MAEEVAWDAFAALVGLVASLAASVAGLASAFAFASWADSSSGSSPW